MDRSAIAPKSLARVLCASLPVLLAAPSMAQSVGDWRPVPSVTSPPSRVGFALAEMPGGDLLLFGGDASNPAATEWRWDGVDWSPYSALGVPRRDGPAIGRFPNGSLLVFGGNSGGAFLADTWQSTPNLSWFQVFFGAQPGILTDTSMAFDSASNRMVLIGKTPQGLYTTWFFIVGAGWQTGPTFVAFDARVVADSVRGEVLLLEGGFPSVSVSCLKGSAWQSLGVSQSGLSLGEVSFDERRARVVLLQPFDSRETVEWDGLGFAASPIPTGQFVSPTSTAMAYHGHRHETVLVVDDGNALKTFRHAADAAPGAIAFEDPCGASAPALQLAPGSSPRPGTSHRLDSSQGSAGLMVSVIGFSHTATGGASLPQVIPSSSIGCELLVDPAILTVLGAGQLESQLVSIPNSTVVLAERYNAQTLVVSSSGVDGASNGLEVQIGLPLVEYELVESFASANNRDDLASGDVWQSGWAVPSQIGGDGRHGSFSVGLGQQLGGGLVVIDTDQTVIPASNTLSNQAETVTDGRFYFTDFVVPAGITVRFVGSVPAQVYVRGKVDVQGDVSVDAEAMPSAPGAAGLVTTFPARTSLTGQPGGASGPGGGDGGNGADRCLNQGPIVVGGVALTDGQPGDDVQLAAGHAYAAAAVATGGRGGALTPATGVWALPPPTVGGIVYCAYFSPGGSGGGHSSAGVMPSMPVYTGTGAGALALGAIVPGGVAFQSAPYSTALGYSSLEHHSVGGSGGGGGGSHGYGIIVLTNPVVKFMSGHGGTGGGGVLAIRSGSDLHVGGTLSSRGGDAPVIDGAPVSGISSPGGGGSGGSIVLQSATQSLVTGSINTRGGVGNEVGMIVNSLQSMQAHGGNGSVGNYRLEAPSITMNGTSIPAYSPAQNAGAMTDIDDRTGSRSKWMLPPSLGLPVYVRYELLVDVGGLPVLYSDDPSVSPLAADDPLGAVHVRFQGAQIDPITGGALQGSVGPWRSKVAVGVDSLNADRAEAVRFDMVLNKSAGVAHVLELRIVWR